MNAASFRVTMKNEDGPVKLGAFEQESQNLLLDISLQNSTVELHEIIAKPPERTLSDYYKELQEWRTPALPSRQELQIVKTPDAM